MAVTQDHPIDKLLGEANPQHNRLVKLDTPLGPNWLLPLCVKGNARLGRDYDFAVDVVSSRGRDIKLNALLGKSVTLWLQQADGSYLPVNGYVHRFTRLGSDGALTYYQLRFSSWFYFLRLRRDMRDWQEMNGQQILADVFNEHPQAQGAYRFDFYGNPLPSYSNRVQWEYDWNFVHRSLEEAGVFAYFEHADDGKSHTAVFTDEVYFVPPLHGSEDVWFGRMHIGEEMDGFTQWTEQLQLESASLTTRNFDYQHPDWPRELAGITTDDVSLPTDGEVYDYTGAYAWSNTDQGNRQMQVRLEEMQSRIKRYNGVGGLRAAMPGRRFKLREHPVHDAEDPAQREFVLLAVDWYIRNNLPSIGRIPTFGESLESELTDATEGAKVRHADGSVGHFIVKVEAQRRRIPFRSPLEHKKPVMQLQSAVIAAPEGEESYTDSLNRVLVWFPWNRRRGSNERASCWVRAAHPDAGHNRGGIQPLRKGDEVLVGFMSGDCDRPVVISRLYGGHTQPVWHTNGLLSGLKSKEYGGSGYNQLVLDDATGQNRVHLYSTSADSHLHLGYLVEQTRNTRGSYLGLGFDLKSTAYGAIRAGKGLYVSTHPAVDAQPLSADQATDQLTRSEMLLESLASASTVAQAEPLDAAQAALKDIASATRYETTAPVGSGGRTGGGGTGNANGFARPILLAASPSGIGLSTHESAHISADKQVNLVSGESTYIGTGKSLIASAAEKISLFVQKAGMKLFAAKGKVEIAAQSDMLSLFADQDFKIVSNQGVVTVEAKKEIILKCGGSYIRITPDGIEDGTRGARTFKSASVSRQGPSSVAQHMNGLPTTAFNDPYVLRHKITGEVLANHPYEIVRADGTRITSVTDAMGRTMEQKSHDIESVTIRALRRGSESSQ